jgi:hypothetical protein
MRSLDHYLEVLEFRDDLTKLDFKSVSEELAIEADELTSRFHMFDAYYIQSYSTVYEHHAKMNPQDFQVAAALELGIFLSESCVQIVLGYCERDGIFGFEKI